MRGLDTNILLRAMLDDDPVQSAVAQRLLSGLDRETPAFVSIPVMMEFFWVLRSRYKLPRPALAGAIRSLLEIEHLEFEAFDTVGKALTTFETGIADFADAVVALRNQELGASATLTFDKAAAHSVRSMELLS
ncbi:MAG: PIN domain-containing protein [Aliihoeflea sp.]